MCNIGQTNRAASAGYFDRSNSCVRLGHPILLTKAFGTVYQTAKSECKHPCHPYAPAATHAPASRWPRC